MVSTVTIKTEGEPIDGTPDKRVFWSIIADYGLRTGLSELVDNALDLWMLNERVKPLTIDIDLDLQRQLISVQDNAGGVKAPELRLLIAPGGSGNTPAMSIIGVFGVGSKRASVAIGEHVEIKTRYKTNPSRQLDVTKDWLESDDWNLASYLIPDIAPNTTRVEISKLRRPFGQREIDQLKVHFAETYSWFIEQGCMLRVNDEVLRPIRFDAFAFPQQYPPQRSTFRIPVAGFQDVLAKVEGGLIIDRDPEAENYGVYIYCNHRLIVKELKTRDVGYQVPREAGVPHPDASLARVIVELKGAARTMPWNSSKSGVDIDHYVFHHIQQTIIALTSYFSSLSRRLKHNWEEEVFNHRTGDFQDVPTEAPGYMPRFILAPLPRVNKVRVEVLKERNKTIIRDQPWTLGLVEAIAATDVVMKQRFDTRNRIALILLDSNFEIALKEFIVHRTDLFPPRTYTDAHIATLFTNRRNVVDTVKVAVPSIPQVHIDKAKHFYMMRNKLIHERASVGITDNDVKSYRETVEALLKILFKLKFS
ncbi:histidine kinase [Rhizobium lusitanum]|uniref:ATP-binding protein n=1 Tax=Rhizobium lusitanum TaxID=293958 RepID=UPI00161BCD8B|nr:ATP-binding protein [Rhizobium lusitanum]QND48851.1 histidine kinase [Rhizobium lusitanum]